MKDSDLSEYEKIRLQNIKRNTAFLASLQLPEPKAKVEEVAKAIKKEYAKKRKIKAENTPHPQVGHLFGEVPRRRSLRLKNIKEATMLDDAAEIDHILVATDSHLRQNSSYSGNSNSSRPSDSKWPTESSELDDYEFEVFAALREWRLHLSRKMGIESYKICQNRTIVELIRRRRDDPEWAMGSSPQQLIKAEIVVKKKIFDDNDDENVEDTVATEASIENDLLECWGIGPAKASAGGFGYQMIQLINNDEQRCELLAQSRLLAIENSHSNSNSSNGGRLCLGEVEITK